MKTHKPSIDEIEKFINHAIQEDLKSRPGIDIAGRIMSNVLKVSNADKVGFPLPRRIDFAYLTFYIGAVAASILVGYLLGNMYDVSSHIDMIKVSYENIGLNSY